MRNSVLLIFFCFTYQFGFSQDGKEYFIKAKIAEDYQNIDSAIILISEAIKINEQPIYYRERADLQYRLKNYKEALSDYQSVLNKNGLTIYKIACCYSLLNETENAATWLRQYLSTDEKIPENVLKTDTVFNNLKKTKLWSDIWMKSWYSLYETYLGDLYYLSENKKYNEMFDVIDSALSKFPDKAELWLWRAKAFSYGNNPKEAMKSLDLALKHDPARIDVLILRADFLRKNGKSKKAISDYSAILEYQPWNLKYLKERGFTKVEAEDYTGAVVDLLSYYSYDTLDAYIPFKAGYASFLKENYREALKLYSLAIKTNYGISDFYYERGRCYYEMQDFENAFSDFCMAIDLRPNKGEYFHYRGLVYFSLKNKIGACHDWEKAISLEYLKAQDYMLRFCATDK